MKLKRDSLIKASQPTRVVKQLDRVIQSYKPVSDHKHNVRRFVLIFVTMNLVFYFTVF